MEFLFDVSNDETPERRAARVYDVRQDWRRADDGKYMVCSSTLQTRFCQTELQALKAAAHFVKTGTWTADMRAAANAA